VATEAALLRVARSGRYVLGPEVEAFEHEFARRGGARHAVGVGSGTDALMLILRGAGIGAGDEVVVPAYTAAATWMAVVGAGAVPIGADVDPATGLLDPDAARAAIGSRTRALIAVHLFGRLAPVAELGRLAGGHGLMLIEDAAHAAGVDEGSGAAGSLGDAAAFSFYPTKTLGALGDAGAVLTDDGVLAERIRRLRSYGWARWQGDAPEPGGNSRLDEIQAAVLRERLRELPSDHARLRALAAGYRAELARGGGAVTALPAPAAGEPPWHQFVIVAPERDVLRCALEAGGVGTALHYDPIPPALSAFSLPRGSFPAAERLSRRALSLPFDPWLSAEDAALVRYALGEAIGSPERSRTYSAGS
jgi:dTDP-4-amino-4,6-dideoxygalactose transaminase